MRAPKLAASGESALAALNGGYHVAFVVGAIFVVASAVVAVLLLRPETATAGAHAHGEPVARACDRGRLERERLRPAGAGRSGRSCRAASPSASRAERGHGLAVVDERRRIAAPAARWNARRGHVRELRHVALTSIPVRVEPLELGGRVEDAVWPRVDAGSRDPLPVADVLGDVAVEQQVEEVARALPPVDAEILDEERRGDERARLCIQPSLRSCRMPASTSG